MYTVFDIADWFLNKEAMTHKKLQKLCYYAQAWYCTLYNEKLFDNDFEAWIHGPVCRELWNKYRNFGFNLISPQNTANVSDNVNLFLERVWATYGEFDGFQLEQLTHEETPWIKARAGLSASSRSDRIISTESMKEYYSLLVSGDEVGE